MFLIVDYLLNIAIPVNGISSVKINEKVRQASAGESRSGGLGSFTHCSIY